MVAGQQDLPAGGNFENTVTILLGAPACTSHARSTILEAFVECEQLSACVYWDMTATESDTETSSLMLEVHDDSQQKM